MAPASASSLAPLEVSLTEESGRGYAEPADGTFVFTIRPVRLFIRIRNTTDSDLLIRVQPEKAYSVEMKDEAGRVTIVKRKKALGEPDDDKRANLRPGAEKVILMDVNRDTWEGIPELKEGTETKYTARAIYKKADGMHVYSKQYTLIFRFLK